MASNDATTESAGVQAAPTQTEVNGAPSDRSMSMQQAKDKAKAAIATPGSDVRSAGDLSKDTNASSENASSTDEKVANGHVASRKRSRSGSRKSTAPRHDDKGIYSIETETDRFRFLTFYESDNDFLATLNNVELPWHKKLVADKREQARELRETVARARLENPASVFGPGYMGFGNGTTNVQTVPGRPLPFFYPAQKPRLGRRTAPRVFIPRKDMSAQADLGEELVPIRLDIEHDRVKLRDTFTWNLHDHLTNPTAFARALVEDFKIPHESADIITDRVITKLKEQITDYYPHVHINNPPLDDLLPYYAYKNDEMRILVKLNITIGSHTLVDQIEWEINNPMNNPEEFAMAMAKDLSLSGEFTTAIAHQIREQSQMFTKSLYITSHPFDGRPIEDADVRDNFLPTPVYSVFRPFQSAKEFTPYLYELSDADLQREELSILRDQRRQKRSVTRRGGPALPDLKDRERTIQSLLVSSVLPGSADSLETARVFKFSRSSGRGRRPGRADDGDSEESESEESDLEMEPAPQIITQSSRGRIIRGAASAAQVAMKANLGRSATPEVTNVHFEPRTAPRKPLIEQREESLSEPPQALIVKLRLPRDLFRQWVQNPKLRLDLLQGASRSNTPQGRLSQTPAASQKPSAGSPSSSASKGDKQWLYDAEGRVELASLPKTGQEAPPIPHWLGKELEKLRTEYPDDSFEAFMKLNAVDTVENIPVRIDQISPDQPKPDHIRLQYVPRVKCHDCPGKFYNPGSDQTLNNFAVHLRNRKHRDMVEQRRKNER